MPLYCDYNATAPLLDTVKTAMVAAMEWVGNPSSIHSYGRKARQELEQSRQFIAAFFKKSSQECLFTSGASEANNHLLKTYKGPLIISALEHDSVIGSREDAHIISATLEGSIDLNHLEDLLKKQTTTSALVSVMAAQNETGVILPVKEVATLCTKYGALFHCDATQAVGKMDVDLSIADFITCSAHKIGGPSGVGALLFTKKYDLPSFIKGGAQEHYKRAGTQNLLGVIGFKEALKSISPQNYEQTAKIKAALETKITAHAPDAKIYGKTLDRLPNTLCLSMPGVKSETQVMTFDLKGVALSSGSACSSGKIKKSRVLEAMSVPLDESSCSLRMSFGPTLTEREADFIAETWLNLYETQKKEK